MEVFGKFMELDKINRVYILLKIDFFKVINLDEISGKCKSFYIEYFYIIYSWWCCLMIRGL